MGELDDQIEAMNKAGMGNATEAPGTVTPSTGAPATGAPSTNAPSTSAPATGSPATTAPTTTSPATKAPSTEVPEDPEIKRLKGEIETLRQQIEKGHEKSPKTAAPTTVAQIQDIDFLGEIDLDELTRDSKALNTLLNKVHRAGLEAGMKTQEDTLRRLPEIVKTNLAIQTTLREKVTKFYEDNKDLAGFKKVCLAVSEEIFADHPDWDLDRVFSEVAVKSREKLGLQKKAAATTAPATTPPNTPRFPKTKSSRQRQKPKTSSLLDEIDAMNKMQ